MPGDTEPSTADSPDAISSLVIEGFKSLAERTEIEIRPLTLLAGANSSGKSSALQPLLLLKQTLEAQFDPGPLLLDGPNANFDEASQLFSKFRGRTLEDRTFLIEVTSSIESKCSITFYLGGEYGFDVCKIDSIFPDTSRWSSLNLEIDINEEELISRLPSEFVEVTERNTGTLLPREAEPSTFEWKIIKDRFLLKAGYVAETEDEPVIMYPDHYPVIESPAKNLIHVPGLRTNSSRSYKKTAVGNRFPGTFDDYVASVIHSWQRESDKRLEKLVRQLQHMGLTGGVEADRINDTQVELRVEQQPVGSGSEGRMINVADVGIGVSQVLPVLVACLVADEGQLVYLEQPEIHLHPRAQTRLADALVKAANRGVRVVVETHSQLLLLALQTRIAEDEIDPERVMLHWFSRRDDGVTEVSSRVPDDKGAFGDWPEDFSDVERKAENRYLDAAERHLFNS